MKFSQVSFESWLGGAAKISRFRLHQHPVDSSIGDAGDGPCVRRGEYANCITNSIVKMQAARLMARSAGWGLVECRQVAVVVLASWSSGTGVPILACGFCLSYEQVRNGSVTFKSSSEW